MPAAVERELSSLEELLARKELKETSYPIAVGRAKKTNGGKEVEVAVVEIPKEPVLYRFFLPIPREKVKEELIKRGYLCISGRAYLC
jgi:hypothetical protein